MAFRVLIIDDHQVLTDSLSFVLDSVDGVTTLPAQSSARAGLAAAHADQPDAVIVDLNLPDRHGLDLIQDLSALQPRPKIVVLTGLSDGALLAEANAAGVDAVLVQDLGIARLIRETCPELPIHASTQMTLTSAPTIIKRRGPWLSMMGPA